MRNDKKIAAFICAFSVAIFAQNKIPSVAVMELESQNFDKSTVRSITDAIADEVLKSKKARVMERSQMEKILHEQGFQQSGACDGAECAVEVGKLLSIDEMIVGSIGKIGESNTIILRLVNISTGEMLNSARIMRRGEIDEIVAFAVPEIVHQLFPDTNKSKIVAPLVLAPLPTMQVLDTVKNTLGENSIAIPEIKGKTTSTSTAKIFTRIISSATAVGCLVGAWKIEDEYQKDLTAYKNSHNGSAVGISKSTNTKTGEIILISVSALSGLIFGLSFTF